MDGLFFAVGALLLLIGIVGAIIGKLPKITGRKVPVFFILIGIILIIVAGTISNSVNQEDQIKKIFGVVKSDEDNGITNLQYSSQAVLIEYRLFPVGITSYPKEIGIELAPKIQKLFTTDTEIKTANFTILLPFQDKLGNITWKPYCSFVFTRQLYSQINWNNFIDQDLLNVAQNVQYNN